MEEQVKVAIARRGVQYTSDVYKYAKWNAIQLKNFPVMASVIVGQLASEKPRIKGSFALDDNVTIYFCRLN